MIFLYLTAQFVWRPYKTCNNVSINGTYNKIVLAKLNYGISTRSLDLETNPICCRKNEISQILDYPFPYNYITLFHFVTANSSVQRKLQVITVQL